MVVKSKLSSLLFNVFLNLQDTLCSFSMYVKSEMLKKCALSRLLLDVELCYVLKKKKKSVKDKPVSFLGLQHKSLLIIKMLDY